MAEPIRFNADLKVSRDPEGVISVRLNGEEMNMQILADSLSITFPPDDLGLAYVTMTLAADDFEIDLDGVEVEAK